MTRPGIEPRSSGPLVNTLPTRPMSQVYFAKKIGFADPLIILNKKLTHKTRTVATVNNVGYIRMQNIFYMSRDSLFLPTDVCFMNINTVS